MDSDSDSRSSVSDHRLLHLIAWEMRLLGWGRRLAFRVVVIVLVLAAVLPVLWRAAIEPEPLSSNAQTVHAFAVAFLGVSPLHSVRQTVSEMSFSFILLHLSVYVAIFAATLLLPGIAAAGVPKDRRSGRLEELVTTPFSSSAIYAAKVVAAATPFWLAGCGVFVLMLPVEFAERLDAGLVARVLLELILQIGVVAAVSVAVSCLFRHPAVTRAVAYLIIWFALPIAWELCVWLCITWSHSHTMPEYRLETGSEWFWTWAQLSNYRMLFEAVVSVLAMIIGSRRLFPRGTVRRSGQKLRHAKS